MVEKEITVFLADDHAMVREALASLADQDDQIQVVGQCGDGLSVLPKVRELRPNVVILDISMPGLNGLDVCEQLTRKVKDVSVLALTMHDDEQFVTRALESGARGYLLKGSDPQELVNAIKSVARKEVYLGPGVSRTVLQQVGRRDSDPYNSLTPRERQVLQLIAEGKTNREVAEKLHVAVKTVDTHRSRLMRKLNIHNQTALVKYALKKGIVHLQ